MQIRAVQNDIARQDEEIAIQEGRIEVLYDKITLEVTDRRKADEELSGRINVQANQISLVVEKKNGKDVIKAASIVTAINGDTSSIVLSADRIDLRGYVTASQLKATQASIDNLKSGQATATSLRTLNLAVNSGYITLGGSTVYKGSVTIAGTSYNVLRY